LGNGLADVFLMTRPDADDNVFKTGAFNKMFPLGITSTLNFIDDGLSNGGLF